ncbi:MAG: hypothetical protein ACP5N3_04140 [Candidatus Nanoarchaeia archaeon]
MENLEIIGLTSMFVQVVIFFVVLHINRMMYEKKKNIVSDKPSNEKPIGEVRVIEKQVFVPLPPSEEPKIETVMQPEPLPPIIEKKEKEKPVKAEEVNELTKCSSCGREIGGSGVIRTGTVFCGTCYQRMMKSGRKKK